MTAINPLFRKNDLVKLDKLHPDMRRVLLRAAHAGAEFIIIETMRGKAAQEKAKAAGHSKAGFGRSPHNFNPALAVDIGPKNYPGKVPDDYRKLKNLLFDAAAKERVKIVWGGDWKSLKDWPHFELENWREIKGELAT